jgi:hypothetical protein
MRRNVLVAERQRREIRANRRVEIELATLDEPQRRRAGKRLGDRSDLEERVRRDVERALERRDAEAGGMLLAVLQKADGDAGRLRLLHRRADRVADLLEHSGPHARDGNAE